MIVSETDLPFGPEHDVIRTKDNMKAKIYFVVNIKHPL